jgi:D-methionine transport system substrate-binding protein
MKKTIVSLLIAAALLLAFSHAVEAKGGQQSGSVLTVGADPIPHAELLELIKGDLAAQGITLKIVELSSTVSPNEMVIGGDLDANFFQHLPYLESNDEWKAKLVSAFGVHVEPFGLYSQKYKDVNSLPNGATIAIPSNASNAARALFLLQAKGLITLRSGLGMTATLNDITGNPKNFRFRELESGMLPRSLPDVDAATINGNYALEAGLNPIRDSLIIEGVDSYYVNIIVVQKGKENDPRVVALKNALLTQKVKDFINAKYDGGVVAAF